MDACEQSPSYKTLCWHHFLIQQPPTPQEIFEKRLADLALSSTAGLYKALQTKYKAFPVDVKLRFANHFVNVADRSLERFSQDFAILDDATLKYKTYPAYGMDLWLKYQAEFEAQPFKMLPQQLMTDLAAKETNPKWKQIMQMTIDATIPPEFVCAAACTHITENIFEMEMNYLSTDGANNAIIITNNSTLGEIKPVAGTVFSTYCNKSPAHPWATGTSPTLWTAKVSAMHPLFKERAAYMNIIRSTNDMMLWRNLLGTAAKTDAEWNDIKNKIANANFAGGHSEIRALSELIFKLEKRSNLKPGKFPESRLNEIYMVVKRAVGFTFQRCPCCYHLTKLVNVISE